MLHVTRHTSADSFLRSAQSLLMRAEAENNLILGIAQGIAKNPSAVTDPYLGTVLEAGKVSACAIRIAPYKLVITRADRRAVEALARDVFELDPGLEAVTGPDPSAADFAAVWSALSGAAPRAGMTLRIHQVREVVAPDRLPAGELRAATENDQDLLTDWTNAFISEAELTEKVDAARIVRDGIRNGRLHVWDAGRSVSMAAWAGKTPSGVRINFVFTPAELRGHGYATACVSALTQRLLAEGNTFCWLYTNLSNPDSAGIYSRIGYRPVCDLSDYHLKGGPREALEGGEGAPRKTKMRGSAPRSAGNATPWRFQST